MKTMPELLLELMEEIEDIAIDNEEIWSNECCEKISEPIWNLFVKPIINYELSEDFGLTSISANLRVKQVLQRYIEGANRIASRYSMSMEKRLHAFQDMSVVTKNGGQVDDTFCCIDPSELDPDLLLPWSLSEEEKILFLEYQLMEENT